MTTQSVTRQMSTAEREYLEMLVRAHPTSAKKWKEGAENALVTWAGLLLALTICWLIVAWLVRLVSTLDIGLNSPYAIWIVGVGASISALLAVYSSVRWVRAWRDDRTDIRDDLKNGQVIEEDCHVVDIKRFQEPEHGGLVYFLRMSDERVFVLYDRESQDLGVQEKDPLASSFQPRAELNIVRSPRTGFTISQEFDGPKIECAETLELRIPPAEWPEQESWCEIPWDELEDRLSS